MSHNWEEDAENYGAEEEIRVDQKPMPVIKGKFVKGQSGNPRGRPKGALGKQTLLKMAMQGECEGILLKNVPKILKVVCEEALAGNEKCMKMVLDRALPIAKAGDKAPTAKTTYVLKVEAPTPRIVTDHRPTLEASEVKEVTEG